MQPDLFERHARAEETHWWFLGRRSILLRLIREACPPVGRPLLLDVGCGTGGNARVFSEEYEVVGVDPSESAIALARSRVPGVRFVCGIAPADVLAATERAAVVVLSDVLEHVPDDFRLLSEVLAVMPAGAHVVITVPAHPAMWSPHDVTHEHYRRYGRQRFRRLWTGLDVDVRLLSFFNARLFPLAWVRRSLLGRVVRDRHAAAELRAPPAPLNALLTRVFSGEVGRLSGLLSARPGRAYRTGLSLIAILRRGSGPILPRDRPVDVQADSHGPRAARTPDEASWSA